MTEPRKFPKIPSLVTKTKTVFSNQVKESEKQTSKDGKKTNVKANSNGTKSKSLWSSSSENLVRYDDDMVFASESDGNLGKEISGYNSENFSQLLQQEPTTSNSEPNIYREADSEPVRKKLRLPDEEDIIMQSQPTTSKTTRLVSKRTSRTGSESLTPIEIQTPAQQPNEALKNSVTSFEEPIANLDDTEVDEDEEELDMDDDPNLTEYAALERPFSLPKRYQRQPESNFDIGLALDKQLSEIEKLQFWNHCYVPPREFAFWPVFQGGKNRYPQYKWLVENPHLAFSVIHHGFFCKPCVLFAQSSNLVGKTRPRKKVKFVKEPYRHFKDFNKNWERHINTPVHQNCLTFCENFERSMESVGASILGHLTSPPRNNRNGGNTPLIKDKTRKAPSVTAKSISGPSSSLSSTSVSDSSPTVFNPVLSTSITTSEHINQLLAVNRDQSKQIDAFVRNHDELVKALAESRRKNEVLIRQNADLLKQLTEIRMGKVSTPLCISQPVGGSSSFGEDKDLEDAQWNASKAATDALESSDRAGMYLRSLMQKTSQLAKSVTNAPVGVVASFSSEVGLSPVALAMLRQPPVTKITSATANATPVTRLIARNTPQKSSQSQQNRRGPGRPRPRSQSRQSTSSSSFEQDQLKGTTLIEPKVETPSPSPSEPMPPVAAASSQPPPVILSGEQREAEIARIKQRLQAGMLNSEDANRLLGPRKPAFYTPKEFGDWHSTTPTELRKTLTAELFMVLCPDITPSSLNAYDSAERQSSRPEHVRESIEYAFFTENEMFDLAKNREDYYHKMAQKILSFRETVGSLVYTGELPAQTEPTSETTHEPLMLKELVLKRINAT